MTPARRLENPVHTELELGAGRVALEGLSTLRELDLVVENVVDLGIHERFFHLFSLDDQWVPFLLP